MEALVMELKQPGQSTHGCENTVSNMPGSARDGLDDLKGLSMPFYFSPPIFSFSFFPSFLSTVRGV